MRINTVIATFLILTMVCTSCTHFITVSGPSTREGGYQLEGGNQWLRITLTDGKQVHLYSPTLSPDAVSGKIIAEGKVTGPITIPLNEVRSMEVREVSTLRTIGLVAGGTVAVLLSFWLYTKLNDDY